MEDLSVDLSIMKVHFNEIVLQGLDWNYLTRWRNKVIDIGVP
jgi:hypothetical protein